MERSLKRAHFALAFGTHSYLPDEPDVNSMSEDVSLDEFVEQGDSNERDDEATTTDESVTPARTTYAWSDEGTTCESCGDVVEQRWEQDGALVCPDCKEW